MNRVHRMPTPAVWRLVVAGVLLAPLAVAADESIDLAVVNRIKDQAFYHSKVMDYLSVLTDQNGPRVTGSPGFRRAADQAVLALRSAGVEDAGVESWGAFGRGWQWTRVSVQMKRPVATTLTAYPADFSPATGQPVSGDVMFAPLWDVEGDAPENGDLEKLAAQIEVWKDKYRGKLRGKIVMLEHPQKFALPDSAPKFRLRAKDIAEGVPSDYNGPLDPGPVPTLQWPLVRFPVDKDEASRIWEVIPLEFAADYWLQRLRVRDRIARFLTEEGVVAVLPRSWSTQAGVIMHSDWGSFLDASPVPPPAVVLMPEQYNRIHRLLERNVTVALEIDVDAAFYPAAEGFNVIAAVPGTGHGNEVVMLGAHLDSWQGATGATDNAAGCAVVIEAMRILRAIDVTMPRTVRAALWGGEEQGLLGSRGYVAQHFGDPVTMQLKPEHARLSAYFNLDNGGGRIRGVYLQQNDMARPIFDAWSQPFADLGVAGATIINTYGSDHLSFDAVGLPAFSFVQDPLDYDSSTHHSNVDDVGHIIPGDLMQAAAVMATFVYQAATRKAMLPRKRLPAPLPAKQELPEILKPAA